MAYIGNATFTGGLERETRGADAAPVPLQDFSSLASSGGLVGSSARVPGPGLRISLQLQDLLNSEGVQEDADLVALLGQFANVLAALTSSSTTSRSRTTARFSISLSSLTKQQLKAVKQHYSVRYQFQGETYWALKREVDKRGCQLAGAVPQQLSLIIGAPFDCYGAVGDTAFHERYHARRMTLSQVTHFITERAQAGNPIVVLHQYNVDENKVLHVVQNRHMLACIAGSSDVMVSSSVHSGVDGADLIYFDANMISVDEGLFCRFPPMWTGYLKTTQSKAIRNRSISSESSTHLHRLSQLLDGKVVLPSPTPASAASVSVTAQVPTYYAQRHLATTPAIQEAVSDTTTSPATRNLQYSDGSAYSVTIHRNKTASDMSRTIFDESHGHFRGELVDFLGTGTYAGDGAWMHAEGSCKDDGASMLLASIAYKAQSGGHSVTLVTKITDCKGRTHLGNLFTLTAVSPLPSTPILYNGLVHLDPVIRLRTSLSWSPEGLRGLRRDCKAMMRDLLRRKTATELILAEHPQLCKYLEHHLLVLAIDKRMEIGADNAPIVKAFRVQYAREIRLALQMEDARKAEEDKVFGITGSKRLNAFLETGELAGRQKRIGEEQKSESPDQAIKRASLKKGGRPAF